MAHETGQPTRAFGIAPPGFRLPDATHVGAVRLQVGDLARSIEYYQQVLGLEPRAVTRETADLYLHGSDRRLVMLQEKRGVTAAPRRGAFGLYHFAILLPDRPSLGRLAAHLFRLGVHTGMSDHLVSESLYLTDPDGLGIEVYADRPRSTWQQRGRELALAADPLDVRDLIAAGGDERWQAMPAGTVMGHMHLHVGDLEAAAAFYHAGLGFDQAVWSYPGALFLSAGGYHHHLGTNTWSSGPSATDDQARLLYWELVVPSARDADEAARSLHAAGYAAQKTDAGWTAADPWGTAVRIVGRD